MSDNGEHDDCITNWINRQLNEANRAHVRSISEPAGITVYNQRAGGIVIPGGERRGDVGLDQK